VLAPVPLGDLRQGTNTLVVAQGNARGVIANIDVLLDPAR
jgi:hypothetical protein